jgi:hypothetical protein
VKIDDTRTRTYAACSPDRPRFQLREKILLVVIRNGRDDVYEARDSSESVFFADLGPELVQGNCLASVVSLDELSGDSRGNSQELFRLGRA